MISALVGHGWGQVVSWVCGVAVALLVEGAFWERGGALGGGRSGQGEGHSHPARQPWSWCPVVCLCLSSRSAEEHKPSGLLPQLLGPGDGLAPIVDHSCEWGHL